MKNSIIAQDKEHLKLIIKEEMQLHGNNCDLNHIDTSLVTDMSGLFEDSNFNGDISQWNTSHVSNMKSMFNKNQFNGNISQWDVSNVKNMNFMFWFSQFNQDIRRWNVANVKDMSFMFHGSQFNGDISNWDVSHVTSMALIFNRCPCEKPWWAIEDNEKRQIAIENYQLMQQLDKILTEKEVINIPKKNKI